MKEFSDFGGLAAHLGSIIAEEAIVSEVLMDGTAKLIQRRAKHKIGEYQEQAGEFVAWAELAESTKQDRERKGYPEDEPGLRSGEMRDSIERRSSPSEAEVGSDNDKMVWFELGTDKQPPRTVLGGAAFESAHEVVEMIGEGYVAHLVGEGVVGGAMQIVQKAVEKVPE